MGVVVNKNRILESFGRLVALALPLALLASWASAATTSYWWDTTTTGTWGTTANWWTTAGGTTTGGPPAATNDAVFDGTGVNGAATVQLGAAPAVNSAVAAVPEPGTLMLLTVAVCGAAVYQRIRSRRRGEAPGARRPPAACISARRPNRSASEKMISARRANRSSSEGRSPGRRWPRVVRRANGPAVPLR